MGKFCLFDFVFVCFWCCCILISPGQKIFHLTPFKQEHRNSFLFTQGHTLKIVTGMRGHIDPYFSTTCCHPKTSFCNVCSPNDSPFSIIHNQFWTFSFWMTFFRQNISFFFVFFSFFQIFVNFMCRFVFCMLPGKLTKPNFKLKKKREWIFLFCFVFGNFFLQRSPPFLRVAVQAHNQWHS